VREWAENAGGLGRGRRLQVLEIEGVRIF